MPPKVAAALLWVALGCGIVVIVVMTWHPWVIGSTAGCERGTSRAWDGRCYGNNHP